MKRARSWLVLEPAEAVVTIKVMLLMSQFPGSHFLHLLQETQNHPKLAESLLSF